MSAWVSKSRPRLGLVSAARTVPSLAVSASAASTVCAVTGTPPSQSLINSRLFAPRLPHRGGRH